MPRGTKLRNVRVSDELWEEAQDVAASRGETLSDVMRSALEAYVVPGVDAVLLPKHVLNKVRKVSERRGESVPHTVEIALGVYLMRHG